MLAAIYSMFYEDSILNFCSDSELLSKVSIILNDDNGYKLLITKKYNKSSSEITLNRFEDILKFASIKRDHIFFCNNKILRKNSSFSKESMQKVVEFVEASAINDIYIQRLLKDYAKRANKYIYMSAGERLFISLIFVLSKVPKGSIFVVDSLFCKFDIGLIQSLLSIIQNLNDIQF